MTDNKSMREIVREPGAFPYLMICLGSLGAVFLVLFDHGFGILGFIPVLVGLLGGITRFGPVALLVALAACLTRLSTITVPFLPADFPDIDQLVLAGAVLAFTIAHCRLQSLAVSILPPRPPASIQVSPTSTNRPLAREVSPLERRATALVTRKEIGNVVLTVPFWSAAAQFAWHNRPREWGNPGVVPSAWEGILVAWLVATPLLIGGFVFTNLRRRALAKKKRCCCSRTRSGPKPAASSEPSTVGGPGPSCVIRCERISHEILVAEIAGWLLVALGVYVFYICFELLLTSRVVETGPMVVIGIFVFRGGIHLLKVAVAARICLQAEDNLIGPRPKERTQLPEPRLSQTNECRQSPGSAVDFVQRT